jgi:hypothetical protein
VKRGKRMEGKRFAAVVAGLLLLACGLAATEASALDFSLGGERNLEIHGFYETQLRFVGEDVPASGMTFSQFRHILTVETDVDIFPDGKGPFDTMNAFTRWLVTYECVYSRACGLHGSADSYGKRAKRIPEEYNNAYTTTPWLGGVWPAAYVPGTNRSPIQPLNPDRRVNSPLQPAGRGAFPTAFPLGAFANLNSRTMLDAPVDELPGFGLATAASTRAGAVNARAGSSNLLGARPELSVEEFERLSALPILRPTTAGLASAFEARAATAIDPVEAAGFRTEANKLLFLTVQEGAPGFEPEDVGKLIDESGTIIDDGSGNALPGTEAVPINLNAEFGTLLATRPDRNRFVDLANASEPRLLTMKWGASAGVGTVYSALMTMNTPIRPFGYFTGGASDTVNEFSSNLASDAQVGGAIGSITDAVPFFAGPDGRQNTTDDLPIGAGVDGIAGFDVLQAGTIFTPGDPTDERSCDVARGGNDGGINSLSECIQLRTDRVGIGQTAAITDDVRPDSALLEPVDLTGLNSGALPARPRNPGSGLFFMTSGLQRTVRKHHHLVSDLDVDFREDELRWGHGASQKEHEFREGYLEFEMFDSQLFARVGKLLMVWGKTELFRNQDRLNPTDIGIVTLANLEESRIGQWAADFTWYWGYVGPVEDVRTEFVFLLTGFEPTDLGKCGEPFVFLPVCAKSFGAMANGLAGIGLVGESRPDRSWDSIKGHDIAFRIEGRWDRFTFAITDFWGWDDGPVIEVVHQYGRRVDPTTGAPVRSEGPLSCTTGPGGPNGFVGDGDDSVPFIGNCLLFNSDGSRRASEEVALSHSANQTLFHTLCTLTFDQDSGGCAFDTVNNSELLNPTALVLGGNAGVSQAAIQGFNTIRTTDDPYREIGSPAAQSDIFAAVNGNRDIGQLDVDPEISANKQALLGCGPRFGTGCSETQAKALVDAGALDETAGGIDFMNADSSVLTQEWSILKAGSPGALVGYRRGARADQTYFEAGVTIPETVTLNGVDVPFTPDVASQIDAQIGALGGSSTQFALANGSFSSGLAKTDFQIEPFRFAVDEEMRAKGVLLFDLSKPVEGGESCSQVFGAPDPTCTELEILSANLERLLITNEMTGADDMFDPPESVFELFAMLNTDERDDIFGDPISGPDGIVFNNVDTDDDGIADRKGIRVDVDASSQVGVDQVVADRGACPDNKTCYLDVTTSVRADQRPADLSATEKILDAIPLEVTAREHDDTGAQVGTIRVDPHDLTGDEIQTLLDNQQVTKEITLKQDLDNDGVLDTATKTFSFNRVTRELFTSAVTSPGQTQDLNGDAIHDLDEDRDGMVDWADDAVLDPNGLLIPSFGPMSDDNTLCGSGIPGDPLQDALQYELYDSADAENLSLLFPDFGGLPPRSPVFCRGLTGLLGVTGYTLPFKRAGGDGQFGRRDFLWQGGRQLLLTYQKKNVFGFALDFAEDITKTSWGIEFSWTSGKFYGNTLSSDGRQRSDEYVLSISMDRPTFINFLNPNRTFFINMQLFIKYFPDYVGGSRRGMFGTSNGPFDTRFVMFFFTGYFQDRLTPRAVFVLDPPTSSGAVLSSLSYRFTDRFSATVGMNHFFGHVSQTQASYFPTVLLSSPQYNSETLRGIAPARNRDELFAVVRWTF